MTAAEDKRKGGAQPGNTNASKNKPWRYAIDRAIAQDDGKRLRRAAERLLTMAANGDMSALRELGNRLDGKSVQPLSGFDLGDIIVRLAKGDEEA